MKRQELSGLIAAVFTPMHTDRSLNISMIPPLVERLVEDGVDGMYVCGSTGEGPLLTGDERRRVLDAFVEANDGRLRVVAQVGHDSLEEAKKLAAHARLAGVDAISATPPVYFPCNTVGTLIDCLVEITSAAHDVPFYYYHIPMRTGAAVDIVDFLKEAPARLPNLVGVKYSAPTVYELQLAANVDEGRFTMLFGTDEMLLSGLCAGAKGAVGSTYNFAAPLYRRVIEAFKRGDLKQAAGEQKRAAEMIRIATAFGGQAGLKALMQLIGVDCGPSRLPLVTPSTQEVQALKAQLDAIGFFSWYRGQ